MFICPNCSIPLARVIGPAGVFWQCPTCKGRSATISLLRRHIPENVVNSLWQTARSEASPRVRRCPACNARMAQVAASGTQTTEYLDVCTVCQFVWFDATEYDGLPALPPKPTLAESLPPEAREKIALAKIEALAQQARDSDRGQNGPDEWWQWVPGLLRLPVEMDAPQPRQRSWVTLGLALLITGVTLATFADREPTFRSFGLIPAEFSRLNGLTLLTSFFLHGSILHLLSNVYFLLVFGDNVEDWLGKGRYLLLIAGAALAGDIAHTLGNLGSTLPCVGASGGIAGIIAFYALKFPHVRLGFLCGPYMAVRWISLPTYAMFFLWLGFQCLGAWQQLAGFSHVSSIAHLGGAAAGVACWLLTREE